MQQDIVRRETLRFSGVRLYQISSMVCCKRWVSGVQTTRLLTKPALSTVLVWDGCFGILWKTHGESETRSENEIEDDKQD